MVHISGVFETHSCVLSHLSCHLSPQLHTRGALTSLCQRRVQDCFLCWLPTLQSSLVLLCHICPAEGNSCFGVLSLVGEALKSHLAEVEAFADIT